MTDALDLATSERRLMEAIIEAAQRLGWMHLHVRDMIGSDSGWPDLFLLHPVSGRILVFETKAQRGRLTDKQTEWLTAFARAGIGAWVVRPADLDWALGLLA